MQNWTISSFLVSCAMIAIFISKTSFLFKTEGDISAANPFREVAESLIVGAFERKHFARIHCGAGFRIFPNDSDKLKSGAVDDFIKVFYGGKFLCFAGTALDHKSAFGNARGRKKITSSSGTADRRRIRSCHNKTKLGAFCGIFKGFSDAGGAIKNYILKFFRKSRRNFFDGFRFHRRRFCGRRNKRKSFAERAGNNRILNIAGAADYIAEIEYDIFCCTEGNVKAPKP